MRSPDNTLCDTDALLAYQQGTASVGQRDWFELHLNTCGDCRQALETDAAGPDFWKAATLAFSDQSSAAMEFSVDAAFIDRLESIVHARAHEDSSDLEKPLSHSSQRQMLENLLKARLQPTEDAKKLGKLGRYDIESIVGYGGMGLVLRAFDHDLGRHVAIKTLLLDRTDDVGARQRLLREAKAVASLHHPNIIQIHNVELWQDLPLIVMPYIAGQTLQQLGASGTLSVDDILSIARQLAAALVAAHQANVIHRDIKPSNVLLERGAEKILLSDFGLARMGSDHHTVTQTGVLAGTPQFMSPEQAQGHQLSDRTDIFSLGSVLYWLCTNSYPFDGATPYAILLKLVNDPPASIESHNREIPDYLARLIDRLMAKNSADRPDAVQTLGWIDECIAFSNDPSGHPAPSFMPTTPHVGSLLRIGSLGSILLLIATGSLWAWFNWPPHQTTTLNSNDSVVAVSTLPDTIERASTFTEERPISLPSEPQPNLRYGALDTIDVSNMLEDLNSDQNVVYWLRRLAYLPASDIPPACIANIEELSRSSDSAARELALVILSKNPFEEITDYQAHDESPIEENPFVIFDSTEQSPKE
jgi:serine/threonine protein kinase